MVKGAPGNSGRFSFSQAMLSFALLKTLAVDQSSHGEIEEKEKER